MVLLVLDVLQLVDEVVRRGVRLQGDAPDTLVVRGELFMPKDGFQEYNRQRIEQVIVSDVRRRVRGETKWVGVADLRSRDDFDRKRRSGSSTEAEFDGRIRVFSGFDDASVRWGVELEVCHDWSVVVDW